MQNQRLESAQRICENPERYQVYEGCGCVLTAQSYVCPVCNGYRFDGSRERVVEQASKLAVKEPQAVLEEDIE